MSQDQPESRLRLTSAALVLANLLPLYGVLVLDWPVVALLLLFWLENVVVGAFNVLRILVARLSDYMMLPRKLFIAGFFIIHYGGFAMGHVIFILAIFDGDTIVVPGGLPTPETIREIVAEYRLGFPVAALILSHGISFFFNYIGEGEYRNARIASLMSRPYGRVVILHIVILVGGGISMALGEPAFALVLLVVLKILVDLAGHRWDHGKLGRADRLIGRFRQRSSRTGP